MTIERHTKQNTPEEVYQLFFLPSIYAPFCVCCGKRALHIPKLVSRIPSVFDGHDTEILCPKVSLCSSCSRKIDKQLIEFRAYRPPRAKGTINNPEDLRLYRLQWREISPKSGSKSQWRDRFYPPANQGF